MRDAVRDSALAAPPSCRFDFDLALLQITLYLWCRIHVVVGLILHPAQQTQSNLS